MDYINLCKFECLRTFFSTNNKYNKFIKSHITDNQFFLVLNHNSYIKINYCFICGGKSEESVSKKECSCKYLTDLAKDKSNGVYKVGDSMRFLFLSADRIVIWDNIAYCPNCSNYLEGLSSPDIKSKKYKVSRTISQAFKAKTMSDIKNVLGESTNILAEGEIYNAIELNAFTQDDLIKLRLPILKKVYLYQEIDNRFDIKILEFSDNTIQVTQIPKKILENFEDKDFLEMLKTKLKNLKSLDEIKKILGEPDFIYQELWGTDIKEELFYLSLSNKFCLFIQEKKSGNIDFQFQDKYL